VIILPGFRTIVDFRRPVNHWSELMFLR
jgi:hypothetical protein